jgi:predicted RNA-binding Zn ribbon-like protein
MASKPAPGDLEIVRWFVNTADREAGTERLADPGTLAAWLADPDHGLLAPATPATPATDADLAHAIAVREALRAVLLHHGGLELDPAAPAVLDAAARRARLGLRFDDHGRAEPAAHAPGVDGALGRLLAIVARAQADGTWERLKVCPSETCQWAFYDRSRNRSAVWCDMKVCGNRAKVRSFRDRARVSADGG